MKKQAIIASLRRDLHAVIAARTSINATTLASARIALRRFQMARLARTHADLLAARETRAAAQFFLEDLYGVNDCARRDADIERVVPIMERVLPTLALRYIAEAIELDCQSELLDCEMAALLGEQFDEQDYIRAYRTVQNRAAREAQLAHIDSVGKSLCQLVHMPMMGASIAAMTIPAKLAQLSELHHFLQRGFSAFKKMPQPEEFVATIVRRETVILDRLYAGLPDPF